MAEGGARREVDERHAVERAEASVELHAKLSSYCRACACARAFVSQGARAVSERAVGRGLSRFCVEQVSSVPHVV